MSAMCRVGDVGLLKSAVAGMEIEDMNSESPCTVGFVKRCVTVDLCKGSSEGVP